ncbi:MAG TPA: VOC family protein [Candidatus Baltobacteraceae bacterium]|jgi:catechol 2,3-dioxygenase-like lactoylglutathione lyase family enzyme|nr:VOC family protein [Candidatus Baltobacteraceae bacterium]
MSEAPLAPPFELRGIEHALLLVGDMDAALAFYQDVLGARLEARFPRYAMAELVAGVSHLDLVDVSRDEGAWARPPVAGGRNLDHIALRVSGEASAVRRHLAEHRVEIVEERLNEDASGAELSLYVRDPSGNTIELMGLLGV